jgi:hypothetical protein
MTTTTLVNMSDSDAHLEDLVDSSVHTLTNIPRIPSFASEANLDYIDANILTETAALLDPPMFGVML